MPSILIDTKKSLAASNGFKVTKKPTKKEVIKIFVESGTNIGRQKRLSTVFHKAVDLQHPRLKSTARYEIRASAFDELQEALALKFRNSWLELYEVCLEDLVDYVHGAFSQAFLLDFRALNSMTLKLLLFTGRKSEASQLRSKSNDFKHVIFSGVFMSHFWRGNIFHTLAAMVTDEWNEMEIVFLLKQLDVKDPRISLISFIKVLLRRVLASPLPFMFYCFIDSACVRYDQLCASTESITVSYWIGKVYDVALEKSQLEEDLQTWKKRFKDSQSELDQARESLKETMQQREAYKIQFEDAIRRLVRKKKFFGSKPIIGFNPQKDTWLVADKNEKLDEGYLRCTIKLPPVLTPVNTHRFNTPPKVKNVFAPYQM